MKELEILLSPKEISLQQSGITRPLIYKTLYNHLTATVEKEIYNETGMVETVLVPNYPVQERALEKVLKIIGDILPDAKSLIDQSKNTHVTYVWDNSKNTLQSSTIPTRDTQRFESL